MFIIIYYNYFLFHLPLIKKKKVILPPTTYVKTSSRPSVPPQKLIPTFNGIRNNPQANTEEEFVPLPPPPDPPRRKQIKASPLVTANSYPKNGNHLNRIPIPPRKRATPKPAFGRFVSPTGGSKQQMSKFSIYFISVFVNMKCEFHIVT